MLLLGFGVDMLTLKPIINVTTFYHFIFSAFWDIDCVAVCHWGVMSIQLLVRPCIVHKDVLEFWIFPLFTELNEWYTHTLCIRRLQCCCIVFQCFWTVRKSLGICVHLWGECCCWLFRWCLLCAWWDWMRKLWQCVSICSCVCNNCSWGCSIFKKLFLAAIQQCREKVHMVRSHIDWSLNLSTVLNFQPFWSWLKTCNVASSTCHKWSHRPKDFILPKPCTRYEVLRTRITMDCSCVILCQFWKKIYFPTNFSVFNTMDLVFELSVHCFFHRVVQWQHYYCAWWFVKIMKC